MTRYSKFLLAANISKSDYILDGNIGGGAVLGTWKLPKGRKVSWKRGTVLESVCNFVKCYFWSINYFLNSKFQPNMFGSDQDFKDCQNTFVFTLGTTNDVA